MVRPHKAPETWSAAPDVGLETWLEDHTRKDSESHGHWQVMTVVVVACQTYLVAEVLAKRDHDQPLDEASPVEWKGRYEARHPVEIGRDECTEPNHDD